MTHTMKAWLWTVLLAGAIGIALPAPTFSQSYLRAGVLLDRGKDTRFQDKDNRFRQGGCRDLPEGPSQALYGYGCEMSNDGAPLGSLGDFGTMTGLELGLGYAILPALRLEAAVQYRPGFSFDGRANYRGGALDDPSAMQDVSAELSAWSGMLAAYLDVPVPEFAQLRDTPVNPFVGIGMGLSRIDIGETRMDFPRTYTIVPGGHDVSLSFMLSAGLAVSLTKWTVEVAWRYTDHGTIETSSGEGRVVWRDGSRGPLELDLIGTKGHLRSHGLNVSLRYAF